MTATLLSPAPSSRAATLSPPPATGHGAPAGATRPELLRLELPFGREDVTVFISLASLRARFGGSERPVGAHDLYLRHREAIDAAAERKLLAGARQPLVLRAGDL
jgi:hypothetical protein